jgi:hypothetical protein
MKLTVLQFSFRLDVSRVSLQRKTLEISNQQICYKQWVAYCFDRDPLCELTHFTTEAFTKEVVILSFLFSVIL